MNNLIQHLSWKQPTTPALAGRDSRPARIRPRSDIELPDQQDDTQRRRAAQCPAGNVGGLLKAGRADMVLGTYVDMLQAISHRSLQ